ncbi:MAG: class I SAM-dependent methyltransferase [Verrucomicrobiia bacterium]|jgi:2-polyprenyl-3-methyl-5-hydroxy-6-metoxy-1,4-benzoquinol methylase
MGELLYTNLADRLFHAPGVWQIKQCPDTGCGLLWLDPVPVEDDLPLIYQDYFTHQPRSAGNHGAGRPVIHWLYRALLCTTGLARQRADQLSFYLRGTQPGRLLDVGCGDGGQLVRLRDMGWQVEGQEVDATSAERARGEHGLRVHVGPLRDAGLTDASFDVVTMSHVIEHVHDPVALLKECHRILKPGGSLVAVTPNAKGYGHQRFRSHWMPLEPPRHLYIFSPSTLRRVARLAGFRQEECWTTAAKAQFFFESSQDIERLGRHDVSAHPGVRRGLQALAFQFQALAVHSVRKDSGDECVLRARK